MSSPKVLLKQYNFQSVGEVLPGVRSGRDGELCGERKECLRPGLDRTMQSVMGKTFLKGDDGGKHISLIFA